MTALRALAVVLLLPLAAPAAAAAVAQAPAWTVDARVTHYDEAGSVYCAGYSFTVAGETVACSWDLPCGAAIYAEGVYLGTCEDRGLLGWGDPSWIDVYCPGCYWLDAAYAGGVSVEVVP